MTGFVTIERDIWNHPLFKPAPMTEREAWMWMIARASWFPTHHRVGRKMFEVPRGSFMTTLREIQKAFMWKSDKRVRTFLSMLEAEGMIGRKIVGTRNTAKTQVTIWNYDKYQSSGRRVGSSGALFDQNRTHEKAIQTCVEDTEFKRKIVTEGTQGTYERTRQRRVKDAVKEQDNQITKEEKEPDGSLSLMDGPAPKPPDDILKAVAAYNAVAETVGWPSVQRLTPPRCKVLRGRLRDAGGIEGWRYAIEKAWQSDFLCGRTPKAWMGCNFDWLCKSANFTKLMEGNYDNRDENQNGAPKGQQDRPDPALEQALRLAGLGPT